MTCNALTMRNTACHDSLIVPSVEMQIKLPPLHLCETEVNTKKRHKEKCYSSSAELVDTIVLHIYNHLCREPGSPMADFTGITISLDTAAIDAVVKKRCDSRLVSSLRVAGQRKVKSEGCTLMSVIKCYLCIMPRNLHLSLQCAESVLMHVAIA